MDVSPRIERIGVVPLGRSAETRTEAPRTRGEVPFAPRTTRLDAKSGHPAIGRSKRKVGPKALAELKDALDASLRPPKSVRKDKAYSKVMAQLIHIANEEPRARREAIDAALHGITETKNLEHAAFYLISLEELRGRMNVAQLDALEKVEARVLPRAPLVEQYTHGRRQPLEVRHHIHPEFWKDELRNFSRANGWELVKKNAKDTFREYKGKLDDPTGKHPPLEVHLTVKQGELDFFEQMSDPNVHVILYSGHSSVGGNGSEAIQQAGAMRGAHPKLVLVANCRGKDNYAEFTNKWPGAHVIMTEQPTYSVNGGATIQTMFEGLARGETYAWMRRNRPPMEWDEPKNNYFYPDEKRKFRFMDEDEDGRLDGGRIGIDRVFDVDLDHAGAKFVRALAFTNSELFYHWEVDAENGIASHFGRRYADRLDPDGPIPDPKPGELVRVTEVNGRYSVRFNRELAHRMDQNLLAAHVTAHCVMALSKKRDRGLTPKEALRAALMGAQAIHYLDVFEDTQPRTYRRYLKEIGLANEIDPRDMEHLFERFDAHANDEHVAGFEELLREKYGLDLEAWQPKLRGNPVHI